MCAAICWKNCFNFVSLYQRCGWHSSGGQTGKSFAQSPKAAESCYEIYHEAYRERKESNHQVNIEESQNLWNASTRLPRTSSDSLIGVDVSQHENGLLRDKSWPRRAKPNPQKISNRSFDKNWRASYRDADDRVLKRVAQRCSAESCENPRGNVERPRGKIP